MSKPVNLSGHRLFAVDDDVAVLNAVRITFERAGAEVSCFSDGDSCLKALRSTPCDLVFADVKMPGMDGAILLRKIGSLNPSLPVVLMTGYGDVALAVKALKAGAADFIEKPLEMHQLLSTARTAIDQSCGSASSVAELLSPTELDVLRMLLAGRTSKEIAELRSRSLRTIEDHRAHIMSKFDVKNMVELLKKVAAVRLPEILQEQ